MIIIILAEEPEKWRRDCKYTSVVNLGCHQHELGLYGKTIVVDECICNIDECNRQMGPIETTSHSPETTTKGNLNALLFFYYKNVRFYDSYCLMRTTL